MKYKPGDKVKIKSLDWYNENKDEDGRVICGYISFCKEMTSYCGKELTIDFIHTDDGRSVYVMKELKLHWGFTDEMIEGLVDEPEEKMVSLDDVCRFLDEHLYTSISTGDYDYVTAPAYDTVEDFVEDFRKSFKK